jgi:citrate synthase
VDQKHEMRERTVRITAPQGMEGVVAADSSITWIDGERGDLCYRGYPIGELADRCSFEDVVGLLWDGELPSAAESEQLARELRAIRVTRVDVLSLLASVPATAHPLDVVRYVLSWDALANPTAWDNSPEGNRRKSLEMVAWFPTVVAGYHRIRRGLAPVAPDPDIDTAAAFLFMLTGKGATDVAVRTLDTSLVLHADHELNASTFAARVTIATQSNLHAAVASALGTLAGPRHGGASDRVITMLEVIGDPSHTEAYVHDQLARRQRIMGFGHRVYKTADPRSHALRAMAAQLLAGTPHEPWLETLTRLREIVERELGLYPNVDLYAALVNHELGIDPAFYTSIFAVSRIAGWTAHAVEQLDGRMIRPVAKYTGPPPRTVPRPASD